MATVIFWKKVWIWFKNYWYWPVIAALFLCTVVGGLRHRDEYLDLLFKQRDNYEKELEILKKAQKEKEEKVENVVKDYSDDLKKIEEEHKIKVNELEKKKQEELIEMVKENKNKPDKLASELARILSAEYYRKNR